MNMQMQIPNPEAQTVNSDKSGVNKFLFQGFLSLFILVVVFGGWSMIAKINGAIIAGGRIDVEGRPKTLQHLDGGIVSEILVKNGDLVNKGDVVLRLDPTATGANRTIVEKRLYEAQARVDRLKAERDHLPQILWSERIQKAMGRPDVAEIVDGQTNLFHARKKSEDGQIGQLKERIEQLNEQIRGLQDLE
ncbi:MAG TPA: biotin/lipoyl-binding protein, partial [Hellea balneolensis]|nr:biotin/lipoyl-binding protein [Hellea balneolensis]